MANPPPASLAHIPVDTSKTEPIAAFYKLQFGDELTGFAYYMRTLVVTIGRNVVSLAARRLTPLLVVSD
jgi:hypothetical protein